MAGSTRLILSGCERPYITGPGKVIEIRYSGESLQAFFTAHCILPIHNKTV